MPGFESDDDARTRHGRHCRHHHGHRSRASREHFGGAATREDLAGVGRTGLAVGESSLEMKERERERRAVGTGEESRR